MMLKQKMSHAIASWLPLSAISARIAMMAGSILNLPATKTAMAAIASGIMTFSAFLMRSYGKKDEKKQQQNSVGGTQVSQQQ